MGDIKDEVADCAKKVLTVFTQEYTKAYTLALVRIIKEETQAEPGPDWHLEKRPGWKKDFKSGFLTKEGGSTKSWKKRFFVVRPSYNVEYYENEAAVAKGPSAAKGSINLCGYSVNTDPNDSVLNRLKKLLDKMGVDMGSIPKPKEYPPLTLELYHSRRRCYYITAANKDDFDDWVAQFRTCCWHARGLTLDDPAHHMAFPVAARKTRWALGRWGWYSNYGSEEQIIAEMISDELEYDIMSRAYSKCVGPWMIRNMMRSKIEKVIDQVVLAVVKPGWAGMSSAVTKAKPIAEPKIRGAVQPIFEKEKELVEKIKDKIMDTLRPIQEEKVNPHLVKIVDVVRQPMKEGFATAITLFEEKIDKYEIKEGADLEKTFDDLDWFPRSYWQMRAATEKTEAMIDGLRDLSKVFSHLWPWSLCYQGQNAIREVTDRAVYTFEHELIQQAKDNPVNRDMLNAIKRDVVEKFKHDAQISLRLYCRKIMSLIVMPPFESALIPASGAIITPLADSVPETLSDFIDINQDFEDLYTGIIEDAIDNVVDAPSAKD